MPLHHDRLLQGLWLLIFIVIVGAISLWIVGRLDQPYGPLRVTALAVGPRFSTTYLVVPPRERIRVDFSNMARGQAHRWVLVAGDTVVADALLAAADALAERDLTNVASVLAASALLPYGYIEQITFISPDVGTYTYLCTVPGHYRDGMRGTLTVDSALR